ncbi:MAG TPA: hypothetical protein VFF67_06585 [Thermoplasmata archaeon]|nr:hypothetical protein [Thermoplasmata archaeon]
MILSPLASASTTGSVKAPFAGGVSSPVTYVSASGCATAKSLITAHWNATTGKGGFSEFAGSKPCASQLGNAGTSSSANAEGALYVDVPIAFATNGFYKLKSTWSLHIADTAAQSPGNCAASTAKYADCFVETADELGAFAELFDSTNGTNYYPSKVCWQTGCSSTSFWYDLNYTYNQTIWSSGSATYSNQTYTYQVPGNQLTFFVNASFALLSTHSYVLELYLYDYVAAATASYNTYLHNATASITSNGATLGNFVKLAGVNWK